MEVTLQLQPLLVGGVLDGKVCRNEQRAVRYDANSITRFKIVCRCIFGPNLACHSDYVTELCDRKFERAQSWFRCLFAKFIRVRLHGRCDSGKDNLDASVAYTRGGTPDEQEDRVLTRQCCLVKGSRRGSKGVVGHDTQAIVAVPPQAPIISRVKSWARRWFLSVGDTPHSIRLHRCESNSICGLEAVLIHPSKGGWS